MNFKLGALTDSHNENALKLQNGMDSSVKDPLNFQANLSSFQQNCPRSILPTEQNYPST